MPRRNKAGKKKRKNKRGKQQARENSSSDSDKGADSPPSHEVSVGTSQEVETPREDAVVGDTDFSDGGVKVPRDDASAGANCSEVVSPAADVGTEGHRQEANKGKRSKKTFGKWSGIGSGADGCSDSDTESSGDEKYSSAFDLISSQISKIDLKLKGITKLEEKGEELEEEQQLEIRNLKATKETLVKFMSVLPFLEGESSSDIKDPDKPGSSVTPDTEQEGVEGTPAVRFKKRESTWAHVLRNPKGQSYKSMKVSFEEQDAMSVFTQFLDEFGLHGDCEPYYKFEMKALVQRGSARKLSIRYSDLEFYERKTAMKICNAYGRWKEKMRAIAKEIFLELLPDEKDSADKLELEIIGMPRRHMLLQDSLRQPLLNDMTVYGYKQNKQKKQVKTPVPSELFKLQKLIDRVLANHRNGCSWAGNFQLGNMELLNDDVVITLKPKSYTKRTIEDFINAMEKDLEGIAIHFLSQFSSADSYVPYFEEFDKLLRNMAKFKSIWYDDAKAERLRELIQNFPFLKTPMARSNLMIGIFTASSSHNENDKSARYKTILKTKRDLSDIWYKEIIYKPSNKALKETFWFRPAPKPETPGADPISKAIADAEYQANVAAWRAVAAQSKASLTGWKYLPLDKKVLYYDDTLHGFVECMRNHNLHGTQKSFVTRQDPDGNLIREQLMKSLNEVEVGAAAHLERFVIEVLILFVEEDAISDMLEEVWDTYKCCNYPIY